MSPRGAGVAWAVSPGVLLAGIAGGIAFPILPTVGERVGLSLAFIGVILAANRAARIVANPFVGLVADRIGGRRTLLGGLVLQVGVMFLYWLGVKTRHTGLFFLTGRIVHGPGSSCVFVAGQALALHLAPAHARGRAGAIVRASMSVGVPIGLVLGGVLADAFGEATTFACAGGALLLAAAVVYFVVPDARVETQKRARLGSAFRALLDRRVAAIGALNFASAFAGTGMVLTTTVLLVEARHLEIFHFAQRTSASFFMGWLVLAEAGSMPILGRLGDRLRRHASIAALGLAATIPALLLIAFATKPWSYALGLGVLGAGIGALGPSVLALVGEVVEPAHRGAAIGALQVCADIGGAAGPLIGTVAFAGSTAAPYEASAVLIALFLPAAVWLAREGRRAAATSS